jgi:acyl-CoA synthetase (AMP-forming)/AMP-acid ligase II
VSEILARFADLHRDDPKRLLVHLPGAASALAAADIWDAHRRYAEHLAQVGVGPGQLVVSAAGNSPASVAFLLACRALDAALMPVDAGTTLSEILGLADRFAAAALLVPAALTADDPRLQDDRSIDLDARLRLFRGSAPAPRRYDDTALLKLTSGSTGPAKAALTSEAQLIADARHIVDAMGIDPSDTQVAVIPVSHSYGLGNLMMPLLMQGTAFVLRDSFVPPQVPADARQFGARIFPGVPFMFQYYIRNPPPGGWPGSLSRLISAGAPLPPASVRAFHERFGVKIHSFYGATETGGIAFDDSDEIHEGAVLGRALPGVTITLRQDPEDPCAVRDPSAGPQSAIRNPPCAVGRIHVRSTAVAGGYSDDARDGFDGDGFLTGDCGAWDARQRLTLAGRVSAFVNVAGRKVQPDEVEEVLRVMPGVVEVRVRAAPDAKRGQQIVACIVADRMTAGGVTALAVRRFCAARLAAHKIPRTIIFLDAIPLTPRGKTDCAALDDLVRARMPVPR